MRATSIDEKHKLDITGIKKRQLFLSAYEQELKKVPTVTSVKDSYSSLLDDLLGSSSYIFVTVDFSNLNLRETFEIEQKNNGGILSSSFLPLGQEYYESIRSGTSAQDAAETLMNKFLIRLNQKVLGARYKRYGQSLKWICVYENENKRYSKEHTNHLHMLVEVPATNLSAKYNQLKFKHQFRELFSWLVYRLPSTFMNNAVLNIIQGRLTCSNAHPKYILKQLVNWETASERVFTSGMANSKKQ